MRNVLTRFLCVFAATLLVNFEQSHAGIIVSNLTATVGGTGTIYTPSATGTPQAYAQEFNHRKPKRRTGYGHRVLGRCLGNFHRVCGAGSG